MISFEFFSWKIGLEMSISSETASALMFCHVEKLERNVVVCEQLAPRRTNRMVVTWGLRRELAVATSSLA